MNSFLIRSIRNIFFFFFLLITINGQAQKDSREWLQLHGKVKSLKQIRYSVHGDSLVMDQAHPHYAFTILMMGVIHELMIEHAQIHFSIDGKIEQWHTYNRKGKLHNDFLFEYGNFLLPKQLKVMEGASVALLADFKFDEQQRIKQVVIGERHTIFFRDEQNRIDSAIFTFREEKGALTYNYPDENTIIMLLYTNKRSPEPNTMQLNAEGFLRHDGRYSFEYQYDAHGNWIKKSSFLEGKPMLVYSREIVYYE